MQPIIVLEPEPAADVRAAVFDGLRAFNRRHAEPPDFRPLTLAARDAAGALLGGLVGQTGWRWLYVDLLWVDEAHRGRGIGRRLLRAAEAEALARGCGHVYLDTFDYQARPFYEREGYELFGVQEDYPPGHRRYFLRKALAPRDGEAGGVGARLALPSTAGAHPTEEPAMTAPAQGTTGAEWELVAADGRPLGRLVQDGSDGAWRLCRFAPTPDFAPIAELFAEDVGLLEEDEMDAWEMVHERIASLRLQLRPADGGDAIRRFALHVDGDRAWFRSA